MIDVEKQQDYIKRTVDKVNKKFKDSIANTLSGAFQPDKVKRFIPSGNLALDFCIGRAGFPVGRISEIAGQFSSGKCLASGTKILMADMSLSNIEDVKQGDKLLTPVFDRSADAPCYEMDVVDAKINSGKQEVFKVTLSNGFTITATKEHAIMSIEQRSKFETLPFEQSLPWRTLGSLKIGDYVSVSKPPQLNYVTAYNLYEQSSIKDARTLIELLTANFFLLEKDNNNIDFLKSLYAYSPFMVLKALCLFIIHYEQTKFIFKKDKKYELKIHSKNINFLQQIQLYLFFHRYDSSKIKKSKNGYTLSFTNPATINSMLANCELFSKNEEEREAAKKIIKQFPLYREFCEYYADKEGFVSNLSSANIFNIMRTSSFPYFFSRLILKQISKYPELYQSIKSQIYDYTINSTQSYKDKIFPTQLINSIENWFVNYGIKVSGLISTFNTINWLRVESIESMGVQQTWDLSMRKRPFFIANGIVVHNSTLSAMAIGQAQKAGMVTILLDTEHSYDEGWARKHGVNPELLIILTPPHIQAIFDQTLALIDVLKEDRDDDFSMLTIVDSVSATPTSEELAQEDSTAGKQRAQHAKALSEGLRKITDKLWNENMAMVLISQLKDNPGIMYGTNTHKLGGSAIDYHAGLLMRTKIIAKKKQNEVPISQIVQVSTTKNKFVPPYRRANFEINYLTGVDNRLTAIDFMQQLGWLKKSGGWIVLENGDKVRPKELVDTITPDQIAKLYDYLGITNLENKVNGDNLTYNMGSLKSEKEENPDAIEIEGE